METPSLGQQLPRQQPVVRRCRESARGQPGSGVLWVVDIAERKVVGREAGVGNETHLLALLR